MSLKTMSWRTPVFGAMAASVLLLGAAPVSAATPDPPPAAAIRGAGSTAAVADSYIVVLKDNSSVRAKGVAARARDLGDKHRGKVKHVYQHALRGFAVTMTQEHALALAVDPDVAYIEQDQRVRVAGTQEDPLWSLDRIDQQRLPLSQTYSYGNTASNVNVYVIDSGIRKSHKEFENRARDGRDFIENDSVAQDCNGHGTHVAGTVGGKTYGVAKRVSLVAVRVLDCSGVGSSAQIIAGIDWVTAQAVKPAVANISLEMFCSGGPCDLGGVLGATDTAISNMVDSGVTTAVIAGNHGQDACNQPIARSAKAITVGATTRTDARWEFSNWGKCVTIYAPGDAIKSAAGWADNSYETYSGTSMAAPHVAGAAALILGRNAAWAAAAPAQVKQELLNLSTRNVITGLPITSNNNLLFTAPPPVAGGSPIAVARDGGGRLHLFGANAEGDLFTRSQNTAGTNSWSPWEQPQFGHVLWSVAAEANADGRLTVLSTSTAGGSTSDFGDNVWYRDQSTAQPPWDSWKLAAGKMTAVAQARDGSGRIWMFGVNKAGLPWLQYQVTANEDNYSGWLTNLQRFAPGTRIRSIAAETDGGGRVHVVMTDSNQRIWHAYQDPATYAGFSPAWFVGGSLTSAALARASNGRLELFGTNEFGVWHRAQAPDTNGYRSNWAAWQGFAGYHTSIAAETNANGLIEVFGVNRAGQLWHTTQKPADPTGWTPWQLLDGVLRG